MKTSSCWLPVLLLLVPWSASALIVDFSTTDTTGPHDAFHGEMDCPDADLLAGDFGSSVLGCGVATRTGFRDESLTEATNAEYVDISFSDDARLQSADPGYGDNAMMRFIFNTGLTPADVDSVVLTAEALQGATTDDWWLFIWDYNQGAYLRVGVFSLGTNDEIREATLIDGYTDLNGLTLADAGDLMDAAGQMTVVVVNQDTSEWIRVDTVFMDITTVSAEVCGDGLVEGAEGCDDGGTVPGDGCDAACQIEAGWTCEGEPSVCTELSNPVPSISFGGLALLAGLLFAIALGGLAVQRRRRAL